MSNGVAAVVQGKPITKSEVRDTIRIQEQMLTYQLQNDPAQLQKEVNHLRANALDALIDRELILIEFAKKGGVIRPQYVDDQINNIVREGYKGDRAALVNDLAKAGMSMKKFREMQEKSIVANVMRAQHAGEQSPPTPKEVEDFYKKHVDEWRVGGQVKISTISIPKFSVEANATPENQRRFANDVRSKIVNGSDFATLARSYSQDSRAEFGGAWEWMSVTDLDPLIANTAMGLKTGGISPVIEKETNYIIISCDAKKLGEAPTLEKMRVDIQRRIQQEKSSKAVKEWMELLRKKAVIKKL
ncbi:MAG: peptidylprolyl isomerase [Verrucomicrobiaceae bacterium]|nr:peptidylprolyl isomerase [Verrucomicrobiaceae bacterium]